MMIAHKKDFKCPTCDMVFNSYSLLEKHMSSYCIGKLPGRQQKRVEFERTDSSRNSPELGRRPIVVCFFTVHSTMIIFYALIE